MTEYYPRGERFVRKTFHRFFTTDTISWFEERGVKLKQEPDGRMFPVTDSAATIVECLLRELSKYKVEIRMRSAVRKIDVRSGTEQTPRFTLELSDGKTCTADYVLLAAGGFPKAELFNWITAIGHTIESPVPSLFTFNMPDNPITALMGVAVPEAVVKITGTKLTQTGPLLITHWGLSGPAILKLSAWGARELAGKQYRFSVCVNWLPGEHEQSLAGRFAGYRIALAAQKISNRNPFGLPGRLWHFLLTHAGIPEDKRWADLAAKAQNQLIGLLVNSTYAVNGKTTFKEEFVTAGGIKLSEIDPQTMQSKLLPGLFFAGEVMDVDGVTGGFNFQHAWTSGYIAATAIAGLTD